MPNPGADTLPSPERLNRLCVRRYGNTSSGSLWYALSYIESCQRVKKGEIVWQVCFCTLPDLTSIYCDVGPCCDAYCYADLLHHSSNHQGMWHSSQVMLSQVLHS